MAALVSRFLLTVRKAVNDASHPLDSGDGPCSMLDGAESTDVSFELNNTCYTSSDSTQAPYLDSRSSSLGKSGSSTIVGCRVTTDDVTEVSRKA